LLRRGHEGSLILRLVLRLLLLRQEGGLLLLRRGHEGSLILRLVLRLLLLLLLRRP
jgi:hypothetical protein